MPENHIRIERIHPDIHISSIDGDHSICFISLTFVGHFTRTLGFIGNNGKVYWAQVQGNTMYQGVYHSLPPYKNLFNEQRKSVAAAFLFDSSLCHTLRCINTTIQTNRVWLIIVNISFL